MGNRHNDQIAVDIFVEFLAWRAYGGTRCAILAWRCHWSGPEKGHACDVGVSSSDRLLQSWGLTIQVQINILGSSRPKGLEEDLVGFIRLFSRQLFLLDNQAHKIIGSWSTNISSFRLTISNPRRGLRSRGTWRVWFWGGRLHWSLWYLPKTTYSTR